MLTWLKANAGSGPPEGVHRTPGWKGATGEADGLSPSSPRPDASQPAPRDDEQGAEAGAMPAGAAWNSWGALSPREGKPREGRVTPEAGEPREGRAPLEVGEPRPAARAAACGGRGGRGLSAPGRGEPGGPGGRGGPGVLGGPAGAKPFRYPKPRLGKDQIDTLERVFKESPFPTARAPPARRPQCAAPGLRLPSSLPCCAHAERDG